MNSKDLMKLVAAGFTKEEILQIASASVYAPASEPEAPAPEPEAPAPEPAAPAPEPEAPAPEPVDNSTELLNVMQGLTSQMNTLTRALQASNILRAEQAGTGKPDKVDDILATIINPIKAK